MGIRLVKTDMAIVAKPQNLQVNTSQFFNHLLIPAAFLLPILIHSVRNVNMTSVDIYPGEQMPVHKIMVALLAVRSQAPVFVQIHRFDL